jgi:hypothetical protein
MLVRLLAWALAVAIVLVTGGPVGLRPQLGHPHLERLGAYVVLAVVWTLAYPRRPVWVAVGLVLAAMGLEVGQLFIPGRDAVLPMRSSSRLERCRASS